jgi:hypothetical protein
VTRAISATSRCELYTSVFFLHGKVQKEIHAILTEPLGEYAPSYDTVVIFPHVMRLVLDDTKPNTPEISEQIYELIMEDRRI